MPTEYFERRERALLGDRFDALYAAPQDTAARGVTVSALRAAPEQFAAQADFPVEPSPFCKAGFVVQDPAFKPGRHPYHHAGVFYSQEPSASSAAPLLGVRPGMRVLDTCAAPGGKSSQLAAALGGQGLLVSNEFVAARAEVLRSNLERMGVPNAVVLNEDTGRIAAALPEFFDRVLVDAPCSGEGMFRKEAVAVTQHCEALVKQCAALGAQILDNAAACLAPGGEMIYSTCTFAPEEDEGQVAAFLQRHPEFELADALGNVDYTFGSEGEANRTGGLVVGTGDLSELALGWATYNGDHMSMYGVNAGVPKTLVRHLVRYEADIAATPALKEVLLDILDTPVSPELLPAKDNGEIAQRTEDLVGPYELHDFYLYYVLRFGFGPAKIFRLARAAFAGREEYPDAVLYKWLRNFYWRFFAQQFKRSCLPDGPKIGSVTLSPRGDWRMPSDACAALWLAELEQLFPQKDA